MIDYTDMFLLTVVGFGIGWFLGSMFFEIRKIFRRKK